MEWPGQQLLYDADADDMESGARFLAGNPMAVSYMPIEGGATGGNDAPWWARAPMYALQRYIDSEFPVQSPYAPAAVVPMAGAPQLGVAADGSIFYRGLPGAIGNTLQTVNPLVLWGALSLLALGAYVALKK